MEGLDEKDSRIITSKIKNDLSAVFETPYSRGAIENSNSSNNMMTEFLKKDNSNTIGQTSPPFGEIITSPNIDQEEVEKPALFVEISNRRSVDHQDEDNKNPLSEFHETANFANLDKSVQKQYLDAKIEGEPAETTDLKIPPIGQSSLVNSKITNIETLPMIQTKERVNIRTLQPLEKSPKLFKKSAKSKSKSKNREKGRNVNLSNTVKFGKLDASLCAHSHAQSIKSFINSGAQINKTKPPNLLSRGAERFLGRSSMFKGLTASNKKIHPLNAYPEATDVHLNSARPLEDDEHYNSVSRLQRRSIDDQSQLKADIAENKQAFKNPVASAQRKLGNSLRLKKESESTPGQGDQYQKLIEEDKSDDKGEIYLRFLRFKQQKAKMEQMQEQMD